MVTLSQACIRSAGLWDYHSVMVFDDIRSLFSCLLCQRQYMAWMLLGLGIISYWLAQQSTVPI